MEDNITRGEFAAEVKRIDDENDRQNHRLQKLEDVVTNINDLTVAVKELAVNMESMQKELEKQGKRLEAIEAEPGDNWKALVRTIITVAASAIIGFFLAKGGL